MTGLAEDRRERFEGLVRDVVAPIRRYALRRVERADAEDVVADSLLVLWRRLDDVPKGDPLPWCNGVVRRCLANAERSHRRQRSLTERLRFAPPHEQGGGQVINDPSLYRALGRLRPHDRELLRLWAWEDLTPRQLADVLGITPNAAEVRLHRARSRLAKELVAEVQSIKGKFLGLPGQIPTHDTEAT